MLSVEVVVSVVLIKTTTAEVCRTRPVVPTAPPGATVSNENTVPKPACMYAYRMSAHSARVHKPSLLGGNHKRHDPGMYSKQIHREIIFFGRVQDSGTPEVSQHVV